MARTDIMPGNVHTLHEACPTSAREALQLLPPFPIVLVTTRTNVLTVNQVAYFTFQPLRIGIGIAHARHSFGLLRDEGAFVINVPDATLVEAVRLCGRLSGRDGYKSARAGLHTMPAQAVQSLCVAECGAHIECEVMQELPFADAEGGGRTWFVAEVVAARRTPDHAGAAGLLCGRTEYRLPGEVIAPRP
ncbi:MAG: flavin reductase family protein [bacterium]